jgi:polyhydroxybutyrate depolymerase
VLRPGPLALALLAVAAAGGAKAAGCTLAPGTHSLMLDVADELAGSVLTRAYDVRVPEGCDPEAPFPVVIDFHGYGSTKEAQAAISGFREKADEAGFLAVFPQGIDDAWNGGWCCDPFVNFTGGHWSGPRDDVGFARAIVDQLAGLLPVDPLRIYATGLSNGGAMTHFAGCEGADFLAAIAPASFPLDEIQRDCAPSRPLPVLQLHGLDDTTVPYDGGVGSLGPLPFTSAPDSAARWAGLDGCSGPTVRTLTAGESFCDAYTTCPDGAEVELCSLKAGHVLYANPDVAVADRVWDFFSRFALPVPEPTAVAEDAGALAALAGLRARRSRRA